MDSVQIASTVVTVVSFGLSLCGLLLGMAAYRRTLPPPNQARQVRETALQLFRQADDRNEDLTMEQAITLAERIHHVDRVGHVRMTPVPRPDAQNTQPVASRTLRETTDAQRQGIFDGLDMPPGISREEMLRATGRSAAPAQPPQPRTVLTAGEGESVL